MIQPITLANVRVLLLLLYKKTFFVHQKWLKTALYADIAYTMQLFISTEVFNASKYIQPCKLKLGLCVSSIWSASNRNETPEQIRGTQRRIANQYSAVAQHANRCWISYSADGSTQETKCD